MLGIVIFDADREAHRRKARFEHRGVIAAAPETIGTTDSKGRDQFLVGGGLGHGFGERARGAVVFAAAGTAPF